MPQYNHTEEKLRRAELFYVEYVENHANDIENVYDAMIEAGVSNDLDEIIDMVTTIEGSWFYQAMRAAK